MIITRFLCCWVVEFKSRRRATFRVCERDVLYPPSAFVLVDGDRGVDLGRVVALVPDDKVCISPISFLVNAIRREFV